MRHLFLHADLSATLFLQTYSGRSICYRKVFSIDKFSCNHTRYQEFCVREKEEYRYGKKSDSEVAQLRKDRKNSRK